MAPKRHLLRRILIPPIAIGARTINNLAKQADFLRLIDEGIVSVGRGSQVAPTIHVYRDPSDNIHGGAVHIGSFCSFGPDVEIFSGGNHRSDWVSTYNFRVELDLPGAWQDGAATTKGDVLIENDVWIGKGAIVLSGVTIGNGAIIGASAVVSHDVRPYAVAVGNPAREVRRRFSDDCIAALERIAWWDWPLPRIFEQLPNICSEDVEVFIAMWDKSG